MEHEEIHELTAAYALDLLSDEEEARLEEHLRRCGACREALAAFNDTAAALAYAASPAAPSPELRARILEKAREERAKIVPLRPHRTYRALAAVAAVLALGFAVWAVAATRSLSDERSARSRLENQTALLADPAAERVPLTGTEGELVFADGKAALVVDGLEPAPAGRIYEAWVSQDGAMRPAGVFDSSGGRTVFLLGRDLPPGAGVAVTVEPGQGSARPSTAPIFSAETT